MFKDIVVNLSAGKSGKIVGDYAISIASKLEAYITGHAAVYYHSLRATQGNVFNIFSTATFGQ